MKSWDRCLKYWPLAVIAATATVASAGSVPSTGYSYDNNGNLHGASILPYDPACDAFVTSVDRCGSCTNRCAIPVNGTTMCAWSCDAASCSGTCTIACNESYSECGGKCVNYWSDVNNCGQCGLACSTNHVTPTCGSVVSACWYDESSFPEPVVCSYVPRCIGTCESGWDDCNGSQQGVANNDGCETSIAASPDNCGACGAVCSSNNIARACVGGSCAAGICSTGYGDCNEDKKNDGCETPLNTTVNCGLCGKACPTPVNGYPVCESGTCRVACNAPYTPCGSACVNTSTDSRNCGQCGKSCPTHYACMSGTCVCQPLTCADLGATCGSYANGCGGRINCGSCDNEVTCPVGYQNCDGRCYKYCP